MVGSMHARLTGAALLLFCGIICAVLLVDSDGVENEHPNVRSQVLQGLLRRSTASGEVETNDLPTELLGSSLPWYEKFLQHSLDVKAESGSSDGGTSLVDYKHTVSETIDDLSSKWNEKHSYDDQPYRFCFALEDLNLRERVKCFNHLLEPFPGFRKISSRASGADACDGIQRANLLQGCMAFVQTQTLPQQQTACRCTMSGDCTAAQGEACNGFKEALFNIEVLLRRQGNVTQTSEETIVRREEQARHSNFQRQQNFTDDEMHQAEADSDEQEVDGRITAINETLRRGVGEAKQDTRKERDVVKWLEDSLNQTLPGAAASPPAGAADSDAEGGSSPAGSVAAATAAAARQMEAQIAQMRALAAATGK